MKEKNIDEKISKILIEKSIIPTLDFDEKDENKKIDIDPDEND